MRHVLLALFAGALAGCHNERNPDLPAVSYSESDVPLVVDMHTSRNSLDWAGTYEGLLATADSVDIHTQLTLHQDGDFMIVTRRLVRDAAPSTGRGQFAWEPDGNTIVLDAEAGRQRFAVGEGRLLLLEIGQRQPTWDSSDSILEKTSAARRTPRTDFGEMLEDHRWRSEVAPQGTARQGP